MGDSESDAAKVTLEVGAQLQNWTVKRLLGEGGCGVVYLVQNSKATDPPAKAPPAAANKAKPRLQEKFAALKIEPLQKHKEDEILKMEAHVLRKLQGKKHVCKLFLCGKMPTYNYMIMSLLGDNLGDLRKTTPEQRFTLRTAVGITLQCLQGIQDMHHIGFVHRDIKPSNFALGWKDNVRDRRTVFVFDFGLARLFLTPGKDMVKKWDVREPRRNIAFRGTVRYSSLSTHKRMEQGPADDLWSLLYMAVEMVTGKLPWRGNDRDRTKRAKERCTDKELLDKCPPEFYTICTELTKLNYKKKPPYDLLRQQLQQVLNRKKYKETDPYDWEEKGPYAKYFKGEAHSAKDGDERRRVDKDGAGAPTVNEAQDLDESNRGDDEDASEPSDPSLAESDTTKDLKDL